MRTKTTILSAVALAAGLLSAGAQVYSANVVGYYNVALTNGFTMVANQLDYDGTGTNNTVTTVFGANLPPGSTVYVYTPGVGYSSANWTTSPRTHITSWDSPNFPLPSGSGIFVSVPTPVTNTFVGQVLQGSLANPTILPAGGYSTSSDQVPLSGLLTTTLGYTPIPGDVVYLFDPSAQQFNAYHYTTSPRTHISSWDTEPNLAVGQGFFLSTPGNTWSQTFTVQ